MDSHGHSVVDVAVDDFVIRHIAFNSVDDLGTDPLRTWCYGEHDAPPNDQRPVAHAVSTAIPRYNCISIARNAKINCQSKVRRDIGIMNCM